MQNCSKAFIMLYGSICQHQKTQKRPKPWPESCVAHSRHISNSNLPIKKPADDEVDDGGKDYKSQILPNFEINCLRTLPRSTRQHRPSAHILKGFARLTINAKLNKLLSNEILC